MGSLTESTTETNTRPYGLRLIERATKTTLTFRAYQAIVLLITFFAYASYHAARKTTSIVKSTLDPHSSLSLGLLPWPRPNFLRQAQNQTLSSGWAPFDGSDGTSMLGQIDVAFLAVYSLGMYFAGHLGDRLDLRKFLTAGMVGTGIFTALFGLGYWSNIHSFYYYLGAQMLAGLFQSTGWPSVVAVVGKWFGKGKRGLIMGIWNAHTSVGNILGSLIASAMLNYGWGWSFVVPGLLIVAFGVVVFLFLPVSPELVGIGNERGGGVEGAEREGDRRAAFGKNGGGEGEGEGGGVHGGVEDTRRRALRALPFFSKLVAYTFLYWLPFYISHTAIEGEYLSDSTAGNLSTLFDVGGVVGGILAGHISDRLNARAITAASFMYCAIPALFFYRIYGSMSLYVNAALMVVAGVFVNGPYALITTAVSADLGTHVSLGGNSRALATVTAIIDGTGSVGAALGPLLTGYISTKGWNGVFTMLMGSALVAGLLLTRLVVAEVAAKMRGQRGSRSSSTDVAVAEEV
ncbi:putative glycerol-3-phosphate transporter 1 [Acorus calamus]|uniref:Glycerol-3-phosphate transporter 1 n=1 Tax=Acorus calamus TaxID=4465 RepID=A0AAV9FEX6_ACOCL|nr:putative glycerol-3-phosphate transporter 1 [Acorus calamus]